MHVMLCALLLSTTALVGAATPFEFAVYRTKIARDEPGQLTITESGVSYHSDNGKTLLALSFQDIREADVSDPARITLTTYGVTKRRLGGNQVLSFRLQEGSHGQDLARYLAEHMKRPVVGAYGVEDEGAFEIPAYHRALLGGSHGTLVIGTKGIRFTSRNPKESRTWLYRDIETIGTANPFHFRVTTYTETFTLDLKERLPDAAYQRAWKAVYGAGSGKNLSRP